MTESPSDAADDETPAITAVRRSGAEHEVVRTQPATSAAHSAQLQGIRPEQLLRSLIVRRGADDYLFVLVPAGRDLDWPKLRRHLGVKRVSLPPRPEAEAVTGYRPGTITPFGASSAWPVIVDQAAIEHERVAVGGGAPGVNLQLAPGELVRVLAATVADVTSPAAAHN
jgi:Cys-tRNA(Pro)/Cys-tRNA(Cys) deacylase